MTMIAWPPKMTIFVYLLTGLDFQTRFIFPAPGLPFRN